MMATPRPAVTTSWWSHSWRCGAEYPPFEMISSCIEVFRAPSSCPELFHLHVVTAFLQESDCGDRPDVGRIHAGQRGNSRGPLTFLRSRSRMDGQTPPHASARHDECGHSQSAEERTPNQDRGPVYWNVVRSHQDIHDDAGKYAGREQDLESDDPSSCAKVFPE